MSHFLRVNVVDKNGRAIKSAPVKIVVRGLTDGGETDETHTDSAGWAELTTRNDYEPSRGICIVVRGRTVAQSRIGNGTYSVRVD